MVTRAVVELIDCREVGLFVRKGSVGRDGGETQQEDSLASRQFSEQRALCIMHRVSFVRIP
jgi:hypothetical protein